MWILVKDDTGSRSLKAIIKDLFLYRFRESGGRQSAAVAIAAHPISFTARCG